MNAHNHWLMANKADRTLVWVNIPPWSQNFQEFVFDEEMIHWATCTKLSVNINYLYKK